MMTYFRHQRDHTFRIRTLKSDHQPIILFEGVDTAAKKFGVKTFALVKFLRVVLASTPTSIWTHRHFFSRFFFLLLRQMKRNFEGKRFDDVK